MYMHYTKNINNKSVLEIIKRFCNYIDSRLTEHGSHVAYIVSCLLKETGGYTKEELRNIYFLCQLHDVGAYKTEITSRFLEYETQNVWAHSLYGYLFITYFSPLRDLAPAVLLHHIPWLFIKDNDMLTTKLKDLSQLVHIADHIDVSMSLEKLTWEEILSNINKGKGTTFAPHIVDLVASLDFSDSIEEHWTRNQETLDFISDPPLTGEEIIGYLQMLIFIIDFRSHHTVTHTITTTSISFELAKLLNLSEESINQVLCGAMLHDLGKIAIPVEILESPGKLSDEEMEIMKSHVDLTEEIFGGSIDETIKRISLRHHEKLNGSGYPRGLSANDLTKQERLVAVADIISALTGTRSYKEGFSKDRIITILTDMKHLGLLDGTIIDLAIINLDQILTITQLRSRPLLDIYKKFNYEYEYITECSSCDEIINVAIALKPPKQKHLWP